MNFYTSSRTKTAADKCSLHRMLRKAAATLGLSAGAQAVLWHLADATEWNDELESWFTSRRAETFTRAAGYEYQAGLRKLAELRAVGLIGRVSDGNQYAHPVLTVAEPNDAWESQLEKWRTELDRFQHATRNGSRAGALPRPARRRAMPSAPARDGERAGAPCDARRRATHSGDPICISVNAQKDTAAAVGAAAAVGLAAVDEDAVWAAVIATVPRADETQRAAIVREIITTVSQSHQLTYIELIRFAWSAARELPAKARMGRWRNLLRTVPDDKAIGLWREVSTKATRGKPGAMIEAKPAEPEDTSLTEEAARRGISRASLMRERMRAGAQS